MLKSLTVENFQAHEKLSVEFDPQVTTIVGPSDVGKSAILRALRWVAFNHPAGDSFIRHGARTAHVTVELMNGQVVQRVRGKGGENQYKLNGEVLEAFGRGGVPDDIAAILNLDECINFQGQHDAPYWFSQTAGEVSRRLNSIVDLEAIDRTLGALASEVRKEQSREQVLRDRVRAARRRVRELRPTIAMEKAFNHLRELECDWKSKAEECTTLADTVLAVRDNKRREERARSVTSHAENALNEGGSWTALHERSRSLRKLTKEAQDFQLRAARKLPDVDRVEKTAERHEQLRQACMKLSQALEDIEEMECERSRKIKDQKEAEVRWRRERGKACPLCGNKIM